MKLDVKKYLSPIFTRREPEDKVVTSVNIEKGQKAFLKRKRLELSPIVRDVIDALIEEDKKTKE